MKLKALLISAFSVVFASMNIMGQMARVEGEILIQLEKGVSPDQLTAEYGNIQSGKLLSGPMNIYRFQFDESSNAEGLLRNLRLDPKVSLAQFNHYVEKRCDEINDPNYSDQWHLDNTGQNGGTEDADIDIDLAWGLTTGGTTATGDTIVVCVIEGGNLNHPDLQANAWRNHEEIPDNGIDDDGNGYVDDYFGWNVANETDGGVFQGGHGTNVMGMIGATGGNNTGVIGANWDVKIMSVTGENLGDESSVIAAYTYPLVMRQRYDQTAGDSGAFVVATNASWGIDFGDPNEVPLWSAFYDTLGTYGILNCGATSNQNINIDVTGDIPTAAPSDYMISVTATNSNDQRTFSAYGATTVDFGAPGEDVVTTAGNNGYTSTSGTSFASPLTAGVIALLYSAPCESFAEFVRNDPQAGADLVRQALFDGVDIVPNLVGETVTGGRINAFNSLIEIMNACLDENVCIPPLAFESSLEDDTIYTVSWTDVSGIPATVRFKPQNSEEWVVIENIVGNSLILDTLSICTSYDFEIGSSCSEGEEVAYTSCLSITTLGCCVNPETLAAETELETEADLSWTVDFGVESYNLYYRELGSGIWILDGNYIDQNEVTVDGLESCTEYEFLVVPACAEDQEDGTLSEIRTKGCGACLDNTYCPNFGENSSEEFIDEVTIGEYTFETGNNAGYALFEDFDIVLGAGETYETLLTPGFNGQTFSEFFKIWIDLNQNGVFSNNEVMLSSDEGSDEPVAGNITIPEDADLGATRMRVAMKFVGGFGIPDDVSSCEVFTWGETEDYCITISDVTSVNENNRVVSFNVYPNPSGNSFNLDFNLMTSVKGENLVFRMFDISGKQVKILRVNEGFQEIDVPDLENGMYIFRLQTADGKHLRSGKWVKTF
ncbi:MAG TPA: S8 family serine peptidase [Cryomorphaceae bacterium]|nr:S8 family serine peptidase [Cryomorphaceae bacterium]